jgi:hypothetical protein
MLGCDALAKINDWCGANGVNNEVNSTQLGVRLLNLNIAGIKKGKHTKRGDTKLYQIAELKRYFGIGCLLTASSP